MSRPVIAMMTDFGLRDHYVGAMKGVILKICPEATLVDVSHEIPAHDVMAGAIGLAAACRYFPDGTIFLVVIDPGVGSTRRALAAEAGPFRFVAPDNGVLSLALDRLPPASFVELADPQFAGPAISRTFEGRDRFAPAAAWLGTGLDLTRLGPPVSSPFRIALPEPRMTDEGLVGEVVLVDRFGNAMTNFDTQVIAGLLEKGGIVVTVGRDRTAKMVSTYSELDPGEVGALIGSSGYLEIAQNGSQAVASLGIGPGSAVRIDQA